MELILKLIKKPNYNEPRFEDQKLIKQKKMTLVNLCRQLASNTS